MTGLQTEFVFTLPKGYVDKQGQLHRQGSMRLATARDEIEPLRDPRVSDADDPFLTVIVLSRVITELGTVSQVTPNVVENLFAADLAHLQDFYGIINFGDPADLDRLKKDSAIAIHAAGDDIVVIDDGDDDGADGAGSDSTAEAATDDDESDESQNSDESDESDGKQTKKRAPHGRRAVIEEVKVGS